MVFGGSQVLIDLEPLVGVIMGNATAHGFSHTLLGATLIGSLAAAIGKPISEFTLRTLAIPYTPMSWKASATGAFVGVWSHVVLDGIMHTDVMPWAPWSEDNGFLGILAIDTLHWVCVVLGVLGGVMILGQFLWNRGA